MISVLAGATMGALHVLSGPDHLAALAPLAGTRGRQGWAMGLHWGLGHAGGVLAIGLVSLALREVLPIDLISGWCERLVGVVLIGIGLWGMRKAWTRRVHVHEHDHDGHHHVHVHVHDCQSAHSPIREHRPSHAHHHTALAVGWLHGMAGGSHLLAVLPALAFPSTWQVVAYLGSYGAGTIGAMISFCFLVGTMARRFSFSSGRAFSLFLMSCSAFAIGVGGYWLLTP